MIVLPFITPRMLLNIGMTLLVGFRIASQSSHDSPLMRTPGYSIGSGHFRWLRDEDWLLDLLHGGRDLLHLCGQELRRLGKELPFFFGHMLLDLVP